MTRKLHGYLFLAFLILLVVACSNPADDKPEATVDEPVEASPATGDGQRYVLTVDSSVGFVGSKVTGSHEGGFKAFSGEIQLVDGKPEGSSVSVNIDTTSLWADNDRLTGHLRSADFFDVDAHPLSTFESTSIEVTDTGYSVTGNLDLHGVTRSITFPATIEVAEGEIRANAEFFIKRFDFDISYAGMADDLIRDEVVIKLELVAISAESAAPAGP